MLNEKTKLIGGAILALAGLVLLLRRSFLGLLVLAGGGYLLYDSLGSSDALQQMRSPGEVASQPSPFERHRLPVEDPAETIDTSNEVDEESWESFPASDSPANY